MPGTSSAKRLLTACEAMAAGQKAPQSNAPDTAAAPASRKLGAPPSKRPAVATRGQRTRPGLLSYQSSRWLAHGPVELGEAQKKHATS